MGVAKLSIVIPCYNEEGTLEAVVDRVLVTIMFCAFEQHAEMQAAFSEREFDQLNAAFSDFDAAVAAHGMFKYQHVGACRPHHPSPEGGLNRVIARSQVH